VYAQTRENKSWYLRKNQGTWVWGDLSKIDRFELADYTLDKMFREKNIIVPKWINRFFLFLAKITPLTFQMRLLRKEFEKEVKVSR
jgi:short-subunit dehydrogenase